MRFIYHRENLKRRFSYAVGLLSGAAIAVLPFTALASDPDPLAPPASSVSDSITESAGPAWEQINNNSAIATSDGPVLELPSVMAPGAITPDATDATAAEDPTDDDATNPLADRVGDVADYEDREAVSSALPLWPPQAAAVVMPRIYAGANYGAMPPVSVIVVRPGGISPIPATSPMLTTPRTRNFAGGWWQRAR